MGAPWVCAGGGGGGGTCVRDCCVDEDCVYTEGCGGRGGSAPLD